MEGDTNRACPQKSDDALGLLHSHGAWGCSSLASEFILRVQWLLHHVFREAELSEAEGRQLFLNPAE